MRTYYYMALFAIMNFIALTSKAQFTEVEAGFKLSGFVYQGDITKSALGSYKKPQPGLSVFITKVMTSGLSFRLNAEYTQLKASDIDFANPAWSNQRNLSFKTSVAELGLNAIYNFKDNYESYKFRPYVFLGAGIAYINVKREYSKFNKSFYVVGQQWVIDGLAADGLKKLPKIIPVVPVGAGFRVKLSSSLALVAEGHYRFLFTDYLDGFSKVAHSKKDHYYGASVGLAFALKQEEE